MALWAALGIAGSATLFVERPTRRLMANIIRVLVMLAATGSLIALNALTAGTPMLLVGWVAVAWCIAVGNAWPQYLSAWSAAVGPDGPDPDKRALPAFGYAVALVCIGVAQVITAALLRTSLAPTLSIAPEMQTYLLAATLQTTVFGLLFVVAGALAVFFGSKRNPWFAAQRAYAVAVFKRGADRSAAFTHAVELSPEFSPATLPASSDA